MKHFLFLFNSESVAQDMFCKNIVNLESKKVAFKADLPNLSCIVMGKEKWKFDLVSNSNKYRGLLFDKVFNYTGIPEEDMFKTTGFKLKNPVQTISKNKVKKLLRKQELDNLMNTTLKISSEG